MKKLYIIAFLVTTIVIVSCSDIKRNPNTTYMPDMAYSRAYETYAERDSAVFTKNSKELGQKIYYNNMPVAGTMPRGSQMPFAITKDVQGDTSNYFASKAVKNPIDSLTKGEMVEAERVYLVNCGICHGKALDGNGPLYKGGEGPYPAKPATLVGDAKYEAMPDGQMFYSIAYGKNLMGAYSSQLNKKQIWQVIAYIKAKQRAGKANAAPAAVVAKAN